MNAKLLAVLALAMVPASADAAVTQYLTRAAFNAAAGPVGVEDFNSFVTDVDFRAAPLTIGGFTLSDAGTSGDLGFVDTAPYLFPFALIDNTPAVFVQIGIGNNVIVTFENPVTAFGADFVNFQENQVRTRIEIAGETITPPGAGSLANRFLGYVSDTPFDTVTFVAVLTSGIYLDNLTYSVPAPAGLALFGLGLAGLAFRRR